MKIKLTFLTLLLLSGFLNPFGQESNDLKVLDFLGKNYIAINIREDWKNQKIYLVSAEERRDTIIINEAVEIDTLAIQLNRFLIVEYKIRGGAGEHLRATKVFCT